MPGAAGQAGEGRQAQDLIVFTDRAKLLELAEPVKQAYAKEIGADRDPEQGQRDQVGARPVAAAARAATGSGRASAGTVLSAAPMHAHPG